MAHTVTSQLKRSLVRFPEPPSTIHVCMLLPGLGGFLDTVQRHAPTGSSKPFVSLSVSLSVSVDSSQTCDYSPAQCVTQLGFSPAALGDRSSDGSLLCSLCSLCSLCIFIHGSGRRVRPCFIRSWKLILKSHLNKARVGVFC